MQYRRLGRSGLKVSAVSLGAWTTYGGSVQDKAPHHRDRQDGARGRRQLLRQRRRLRPRRGRDGHGPGLRRPRHPAPPPRALDQGVLADVGRVNDRGLSRKHVLESIDLSLERMQTDYVDIYFAHRYDPETPMEEIVEAFSDVVRSGQRAVLGHQRVERGADRRGPHLRQGQRPGGAGHRAAAVLDALPRAGRGADPAGHRAQGHRPGRLEPAGDGHAHRQVRRGLPRRQPPSPTTRTSAALLTDENVRARPGAGAVADDLGITRAPAGARLGAAPERRLERDHRRHPRRADPGDRARPPTSCSTTPPSPASTRCRQLTGAAPEPPDATDGGPAVGGTRGPRRLTMGP
jgi:hypothetical protein